MAYTPPIIAIIGRPNVGKSTLFNRALGEQRAIVEDEPGVTRDRNYGLSEQYSLPFLIVDTGGIEGGLSGVIEEQVVEQAKLAAREAHVVLVLFDGNQGVQPADAEVIELVRREQKPTYFLVNKCDGLEQVEKTVDFYSLGVQELIDISALHGHNVRELFERVLVELPNYQTLLQSYQDTKQHELEREEEAQAYYQEHPEAEEELDLEDEPEEEATEFAFEEPVADFADVFVPEGEDEQDETREYLAENRLRPLLERKIKNIIIEDPEQLEQEISLPQPLRVAIIGKPNVGKSTLLNTLVGEERAITSPISGTTRDALDIEIIRDGESYRMIDTAGLRKQTNVKSGVERFSVLRALRVINECDVALVVIDATEGVGLQDEKIVGLAHDAGKGIILVINKWDAVEKDYKTVTEYTENIKESLAFARYAPIIFVSALTGKRCSRIIEAVREVAITRLKRIPTGMLNRVVRRALNKIQLPIYRGRPVKLYYASQIGTEPPRFSLFFNYPKEVHFSHLRAIKNTLREAFGFEGTDIKLVTRKRSKNS